MSQISHDPNETRQDPGSQQRLIDAARAQVSDSNPRADSATAGQTHSSSSSRGRPLPKPGTFPGYTITREIHGGGQGVVYQAMQESTRQKVALKVIHDGPFADPRNRARLERGVRILAELNHPNIVRIVDSGEANGSMFYVMDYIPGQALDAWLDSRRRTSQQSPPTHYRSRWRWSSRPGGSAGSRRRQQSDVEELIRLFIKICDATNAAHLRGVIHRDLKPGNIRVDDSHEPHLLDFDLAKVLGGDMVDDGPGYAKTVTGEFLGTLRWASPEQVERAPGKIDIRTDVYSLGVIFYEALTGITPYPMLGTRREIEDHILHTDPPPPSRHRTSLDPDLDAIILKCLAKPRERRYHSAGPIADDFRSLLAGAAVSAQRDSSWYTLKRLMRRHRLATSALFCVAGTLVGTSAVSLHFWNEERQAQKKLEQVTQRANENREATNVAGLVAMENIHRMALGWFMLAWQLDQEQAAKTIRDRTPSGSPEFKAMQFLLDGSQPPEQFTADLTAETSAMGYYVVGERALKQKKIELAKEAFDKCLKNAPQVWFRAPAEARLAELKKTTGS